MVYKTISVIRITDCKSSRLFVNVKGIGACRKICWLHGERCEIWRMFSCWSSHWGYV